LAIVFLTEETTLLARRSFLDVGNNFDSVALVHKMNRFFKRREVPQRLPAEDDRFTRPRGYGAFGNIDVEEPDDRSRAAPNSYSLGGAAGGSVNTRSSVRAALSSLGARKVLDRDQSGSRGSSKEESRRGLSGIMDGYAGARAAPAGSGSSTRHPLTSAQAAHERDPTLRVRHVDPTVLNLLQGDSSSSRARREHLRDQVVLAERERERDRERESMMALGGGAAGAGGRAVARSERYADVSEEVMDHLRHRGGGSSSYSASSSRAAAALRQQELAGADNQSQMITGKITSSAAQPSSRRGSSRVVPMHAIEKSKYVDPSLLGEDPRVLTDSTRSRGTTSSSSSRSRGGAAVVPGTNAATSSSSAGPGGAANGNNYDPARGGGGGGSHQMVPTVQRTPNAQRERLREAEHLAIFETAKHLSGGRTELRSPFSGWQRNLVGLRNLGNTCFLNSSIQCLLSIPQLQTYFRERFSEADLNERTAPLKGKLAREFSALLEEVRGSSSSRSAVLSPASLRNLIIRYAPQFSGYSQQDSHEALRFLLDGLHEDLNRVKSKPKYCEMKDIKGESVDDAALRWWRYSMSHGDSPINDIFGGQLLSETRCGMCGHKSWTFDVFLDLSLPIPARPGGMDAPVELTDCFRCFTEKENLDADYHCEACKARKGLTKRLTIYKPPRVLVVHLKRFSHSRFSREKLNTLVRFPTTNLDLSEYVEASNSVPVYDLAAVSQHSGSMGGGHYTAACRVNSNEWANISDSHVSATSERHIEDRSAYVLFYVRRKASAAL